MRLVSLSLRLFALLAVLALPARAQNGHDATLQDLRIDVVYLASDLLEGRETGSDGEALAASYIASRFAEIGLEPGYDGSWMQPFEFRVSDNPHAGPDEGTTRTGNNVVGWLDNGAATTVIVGAHFDHLGLGGTGSRAPGVEAIHNGADDNASGVAAMLAIAQRLVDSEARANNYRFVAFSGEELGLIGSKKYVEAVGDGLDAVNYMINLDMVGRLNEERTLALNGTGTSPSWDTAITAAATKSDLKLARHESGLGPSDHSSFYLEDLPVLHLFTGQHEEYHKPEDDSERINYTGLADIADFAVAVVEGLDGGGSIAFTKTQDEDQSRQMSFKVTLGVMPDYVYDGEGLKIDAVLDGRPAIAAGVQKDDVVIRIGDFEIGDVYAYMEALGKFEPGQETLIVVRRGDEVLELPLKF